MMPGYSMDIKKRIYKDKKGYARFKDTNELVHRKVAAKKMGGRIYSGYVIHHRNENKMDFSRGNLTLTPATLKTLDFPI